ncbi:hypothetical protein AAC387_Pa04g2601 [Persea americana]
MIREAATSTSVQLLDECVRNWNAEVESAISAAYVEGSVARAARLLPSEKRRLRRLHSLEYRVVFWPTPPCEAVEWQ